MVLRKASATADFFLRFGFFALAPWVFLFFSLLAPVGAILVNFGLALVVFFAAELLRPHVHRRSLVYRLLRRQFALEDYYRERPPRPFLYYLLYPLMAPYWLIRRGPRYEFRLFRRFLFANVALLVIFRLVEYQHLWAPDIGWRPFLKASALILVFQIAFMTSFIVPIMVTAIDCKLHGKRRRLAVYAAVFMVSSALVVAAYAAQPPGALTSIPVCARMRERSEAQPERAKAAQVEAIEAAQAVVGEGTRAKRKSGEEITGPPLDRAREALGGFYRGQEVDCFRLFAMTDQGAEVLVLRGNTRRNRSGPVWMALRAERQTTRVLDDAADLPGGDAILDELTKTK